VLFTNDQLGYILGKPKEKKKETQQYKIIIIRFSKIWLHNKIGNKC